MSAGLKAVFLAERTVLLRLLTARLRDAEVAEDVLQDVWVKLEGIGSGPVADPAAYLYRMANNLAFDRRRSELRRRTRDDAWVDMRGDADDGPSAEQVLISRERLQVMQQAIAALPDRTAAIFRRYRFDEIPRKDIAAEQGISVSAVEKHLQRAYRTVIEARARLGVDRDGC